MIKINTDPKQSKRNMVTLHFLLKTPTEDTNSEDTDRLRQLA